MVASGHILERLANGGRLWAWGELAELPLEAAWNVRTGDDAGAAGSRAEGWPVSAQTSPPGHLRGLLRARLPHSLRRRIRLEASSQLGGCDGLKIPWPGQQMGTVGVCAAAPA